MMILSIMVIIAFIIVVFFHVAMLRSGTHIGEKGYSNMLIQNVACIAEAVLLFIITWILVANNTFDSIMYPVFCILIGCALLFSGIIGIRGLMREKQEDIVTETLSDISVTPAGYHNQDRKLEGTVNGTKSWFMLRGADKKIAGQIKESGTNQVTVVYHASNRRIENIYF